MMTLDENFEIFVIYILTLETIIIHSFQIAQITIL